MNICVIKPSMFGEQAKDALPPLRSPSIHSLPAGDTSSPNDFASAVSLLSWAAFSPKNMTAGELTDTAFWCRRTFNSTSSIIRRAFEPNTNMRTPYRFMTYMVYNPLFRREVFNKQGITFGYEGDEK